MEWYVICVESNNEERVRNYIEYILHDLDIAYSILIPKRELVERRKGVNKKVLKCLFPGYIFVNTPQIVDFYYGVKVIPSIHKFLMSDGMFLKVEEAEIEQLYLLLNCEGVAVFSEGRLVGERVIIERGPLCRCTQNVVKIDKRKKRAKIAIQLAKKVIHVQLGLDVRT
ncbi:antiterminator LoaP [[Clostridium] polysaccharolyticum]|uniref:antiterminator LoaP n=1 Tax=[Clostridium] polysaccharolyticum TaxID=29364 RepID=UPI000B855CA0|nr:antiterminator LoaP [[Clostridium] polysaccharolyticum]